MRAASAVVLTALLLSPALAAAAAPTTASNRRAAARDTAELLRLLMVPPGAEPLAVAPHGSGGLMRAPYARPGTSELVDRHRIWRVRASLGSVVAFLGADRPSGSRETASGRAGGRGVPPNRELAFSFPAIAGRISTRWVTVTTVALRRGVTGIRVDAEDVWIVARPRSERIPTSVRAIDIGMRAAGSPFRISVRVTDRAKIAQIVARLDALGIVQPGGVYQCPAFLGQGSAIFEFRGIGGRLLAEAAVPLRRVSGPCNPIELGIHGRRRTPLVGGGFFAGVERLLGIRSRR